MAHRAVSAIIIFLNEARFLKEAVVSVLEQSLSGAELLLVDDGSSDGSTALARRLAEREPGRVRYLCHPGHVNRGMSASRNLGLAHASGEYIGFLDADDVWLPDKLAEQVAILERELEAGLVYGRTLIWHSWTDTPTAQDFFYDLGVEPDRLYHPPRLFELLLENKAQSPTTCNALMRRTLCEQVGGFEEVFGGMFEDQAFFAKALLKAPVYVDGRIWACYRQHQASCGARSAAAGGDFEARREFLRWLDAYLAQEPQLAPGARRALRREVRQNRLLAARHRVPPDGQALAGPGMIPTASVVMPFLNQESYLAEAIESVRAQTLDSWELLLIDDGSTDQGPAIARSYVLADPHRIRLLQHPDHGRHGAAAARNLGLQQAQGEFIAFLDADDVYERDKIETQVALLRSRPEAAMLYGPALWWYPGAERPLRREHLGVEPGRVYLPPELAIRILLRHKGAIPCTCAVLIRRAAALAVGGFDREFRLYEDQTLWAKLFVRYPVLIAGRPTARYRQHNASTSAQAARIGEYHNWRRHEAEARFLTWFTAHCAGEAIADPDLARALGRAVASYRRPSAAAGRTARYLIKRVANGLRRRAEQLLTPGRPL